MLKKCIFVFLIMITVITYLPNIAFAKDSMDEVISDGKSFLASSDGGKAINEDKLSEASKTIYNVLFTIAVVLAVAVGMVIGIKFIISSADEKAQIKETLVPYVIGVFVVFSAFGIWKIAVGLGEKVSPTPVTTQQRWRRRNIRLRGW